MYISDIKTSFRYLAASAFLAAFGAVYEWFSHGVYSYYMIYAFAIPLAGGAIPYMARYLRRAKKIRTGGPEAGGRNEVLWHAAIATLTSGSILKGVLDIYGTTNHLLAFYPAAAAALVIAFAAIKLKARRAA